MRILVNYDLQEKNYLTVLQWHLKKRGLEALATSSNLQLSELLEKAKAHHCDGIYLINPQTLSYCVPGVKPTLSSYRGSRLEFSIPTIVGDSLKNIHGMDHGSFLLGSDLDKFKYVKFPRFKYNWSVLTESSMFEECYKNIKDNSILIAYDIETKTYNTDEEKGIVGDTLVTCCTWACLMKDMSIKSYVLPMINFDKEHWVHDNDYVAAIDLFRKINRLQIPKVMHNGMYDCLHSIVYHAEPHNWILDTMGMAYSQYSSLPKTLDFVSSLVLPDYCQWKNESEEAKKNNDIQRYWGYNAVDAINTLRICMHYLNNLPAYAHKNYQMLFKLAYPALYCNFEGMLIDQPERLVIRKKEEIRLENELKILKVMAASPDFNPSSSQQVAHLVYDILGAADPHVGKKKDAKTGIKSRKTRATDEKNLKAVGSQHPILLRVTNAVISYREARKAISTYFDFLQKNGRLLYSINPFGTTDTGRMSAASSSFWCGTQIQNIPQYAKSMLIADEGYVLDEFDKSQSEARCTGYLAKDWKLVAALENPTQDFYKSLGTLFFGMPYETVTKEFRNDVLKKIVHGTNYKMGDSTFAETAGTEKLIFAAGILGIKLTMSNKKAEDGTMTIKSFSGMLLEAYHKPFDRVRPWYDEVKAQIRTTHMLTSPLGYTRYFFGDIDKKYQIHSSAIAHGPQNLSVTILNKGFWKVWQLVKKYKGLLRLKAQIHDSVLTQRPKDREDIRLAVLKEMTEIVKVNGRDMYIPNDMKTGYSWGSMTEHPRIALKDLQGETS